jgi:L-lactate dehydrogenase complex protein LldG
MLGGSAQRVRGGPAAADAIEAIARQHSESPEILYEPGRLVYDLGLHLALRARGVKLVTVESAGERMAELEIGLTCAELAIAQSGTMLIGGEVGGWGLAASLPRVHIALLRAADIEPDLAAAFSRFERAFSEGQRNWVWVSGPSKTADIAMQLVTGVHGPNTLEVLIVDGRDGGGE